MLKVRTGAVLSGPLPDTFSAMTRTLSEVALKVWQAPCTLSASVGPASQTELSASAALALCVLWRGAGLYR